MFRRSALLQHYNETLQLLFVWSIRFESRLVAWRCNRSTQVRVRRVGDRSTSLGSFSHVKAALDAKLWLPVTFIRPALLKHLM